VDVCHKEDLRQFLQCSKGFKEFTYCWVGTLPRQTSVKASSCRTMLTPYTRMLTPYTRMLSPYTRALQDMNENLEERINLQKAVFEIEDANLFNRYELKQLEEFLAAGKGLCACACTAYG